MRLPGLETKGGGGGKQIASAEVVGDGGVYPTGGQLTFLPLMDLSSQTLCEAYSGSPELLTKNDYEAMVDWYGVQSKCEERGTCNSRTYSYHNIANLFLRSVRNAEKRKSTTGDLRYRRP
jgi:hypothetical protein